MMKSFLSALAIALPLSLSVSPAIVLAEMSPEEMHVSEGMDLEKLFLIEELRILTKSDENATQILDLMMQQMQDQAKAMGASLFGDDPSPEMTKIFNETFERITDRMYTLMQEEIDFVVVQERIEVQLYDEYYTADELRDLIDFYKTPTGQKTAEILPQMTQRSMQLFSAEITPAMVSIQQQVLMEEFAFGFGAMSEGAELEGWEEYDPYSDPDSELYMQESPDTEESSI